MRDVYIIAEIGVNHDGSRECALELVHAAVAAGANAVKFQFFQTDLLLSADAKLAAYQAASGEADPVSMLRRLELPINALRDCTTLAHELGIHSIVTAFSTPLVEQAQSVPFDAYKTASPDIIHKPLLEALARTGKPMIVSTGAATLDEVQQALRWLSKCLPTGSAGGVLERLAFLQCVSSYPTPLERACITAMRDLSELHRGPIGYSDHTPDVQTGGLAVEHGAVILEKHFTHDRAAQGPDHAASLDFETFREYVQRARSAAKQSSRTPTLPYQPKIVTPIEQEVRRLSRQSLVTTRALAVGERLAASDLTIKRPGTGIPPADFDRVLGMVIQRNMPRDTVLRHEDIAEITSAAHS